MQATREVWRHGPSGLTYLVERTNGEVRHAEGPVDPKLYHEAVAFHDTRLIADVLDGDLPISGGVVLGPSNVAMPVADMALLTQAIAVEVQRQVAGATTPVARLDNFTRESTRSVQERAHNAAVSANDARDAELANLRAELEAVRAGKVMVDERDAEIAELREQIARERGTEPPAATTSAARAARVAQLERERAESQAADGGSVVTRGNEDGDGTGPGDPGAVFTGPPRVVTSDDVIASRLGPPPARDAELTDAPPPLATDDENAL